jgi:hypothetical protein
MHLHLSAALMAAAMTLPGIAAAQEDPAEKPETEQSAILPSAEEEDGPESAAPTMVIECDDDPENCIEPLAEPATGPALSAIEGSEEAPPARVVAEP